MQLRCGERLKGMRELFGLTREEFCELTGIDVMRMKNIEQRKIRVAEDEFAIVGRRFPEFLHWIAYEGQIHLSDLRNSQETLCRLAGAKFEAGQIPKGYFLEEKIIEQPS